MSSTPLAGARVRSRRLLRALAAWLPTGNALPADDWARRHRAISVLLWGHVAVLPVYGIATGQEPVHAVLESIIVGVLAALGGQRVLHPTVRSVMVTSGLVTASAILTHFSGGLIEMHFHFFVVVAVVSLYQSWVPFLVALGFVVVHHGVGGQLAPWAVYNHSSAVRQAWLWALIHGGFVLAESAACLVAWRLNEVAVDNERSARRAVSDLAAAQSVSSVGSWDWDMTTDRMWWSEELYRIFGRDQSVFAPTFRSFLDSVVGSDRDRVRGLIEACAHGSGILEGDWHIERPDGTRRVIHARVHAAQGQSTASKLLGTCQDITERKALEAEVEHRALHDALTGLANRVLFLDRVEHALVVSRRTALPLGLLYVDLDDFKNINDNLGHGVGDELLVQVAQRLTAAVRSGDTVARLGGDEFAILLESTSAAGAGDVADKLLDALSAGLRLGEARLVPRASIGVAMASPADDADDLLRHADIAMYAAKRQGKHRYRLFTDCMQSSLASRMQLEAELAGAVEDEQFVLHYQPLVDLTTGAVEGFEALVRWKHPRRGLLPPAEFISVAEDLGLMTALGAWVLRTATSQAPVLQAAVNRPVYVSVNVAASQLHTDIVGTVSAALSAAGLSPAHLVAEITETSIMTEEHAFVEKLAGLREMGVRIAIDDFGTGYSSLASLRQLPVDVLKIDRSFVARMTAGPEESALAHAIIKLGGVYGLRIVAEGIETSEQARRLREFGCDTGQGFYYQRPADLDSLITAIAAQADAMAEWSTSPPAMIAAGG